MAASQKLPETTLRIVRTFKAKPDRVFRAFTDPALLKQWFCPDGFGFSDIAVDPKTGLGARFEMCDQTSGQRYVFVLDYNTVDAPRRIVWTSTFGEGFGEPGNVTRATLEFRPVSDGTEVTLTHEGFQSKETRADHEQGWGACLDKLARILERESA